jgi:hypothetical protein
VRNEDLCFEVALLSPNAAPIRHLASLVCCNITSLAD